MRNSCYRFAGFSMVAAPLVAMLAMDRSDVSDNSKQSRNKGDEQYCLQCVFRKVAMDLLTWVQGAAPFVAMIIVECLHVGVTTLSKAAMTKGMSNYVFVVYWNAVAAIILFPFAVFRKNGTPITLSVLCKLCIFSLIGSISHLCAFTGIKYSSPTLAAAIGNLVPLITFVIAIVTRMEKFDLRSSAGLAISLGTVAAVLGASIATLYPGPGIFVFSYPSDFHALHSQYSNWVFGGFFLTVTSFSASVWYIYMAAVVGELPDKPTIIFVYCFLIAIITGIFSIFMETNPNAWKMTANIELLSILFTGIFGAVITYIVHIWCLQEKGATYTVMFKPLGIVVSMAMVVLFLGETLHIGSLVGGIVVVLGFYTVMWGKAKEQSLILNTGVDGFESCSQNTPLLLNNPDEEI